MMLSFIGGQARFVTYDRVAAAAAADTRRGAAQPVAARTGLTISDDEQTTPQRQGAHGTVALIESLKPQSGSGRYYALVAAGAASVASFLAAVFTEIYLCDVCSCQEVLRRNGRG
jgi:hypothetical protein